MTDYINYNLVYITNYFMIVNFSFMVYNINYRSKYRNHNDYYRIDRFRTVGGRKKTFTIMKKFFFF